MEQLELNLGPSTMRRLRQEAANLDDTLPGIATTLIEEALRDREFVEAMAQTEFSF